MHDSGAMRVGEGVENLRGDLDSVLVRDVVGAHRLAHRSPGHVLVCDVDVARVVTDVVGPHAAVVAKPPCGQRLPLGRELQPSLRAG